MLHIKRILMLRLKLSIIFSLFILVTGFVLLATSANAAVTPAHNVKGNGWNPLAGPSIMVIPQFLEFGNQELGTTSTAQIITISNTGDTDLFIDTITLTGVNPLDFTIENDNCSLQFLPPSRNCTTDVTFSPTSEGPRSAVIPILSNDPFAPIVNVSLDGTGIIVAGNPLPDIKVNGTDGPLDIGGVAIPISITVALSANDNLGSDADWWLIANTPVGWYRYNVGTDSWIPGQSVSYQGALFDLATFEVLNISSLPIGTSTFYFGVDTIMNGSLDMDRIFYDSVDVNVFLVP
jgi:hypothetical protein